MMQVQMPKFACLHISADCAVEPILTYRTSLLHSNCCLSLYLNVADVRQGTGKCFWGPGKVLEIFL